MSEPDAKISYGILCDDIRKEDNGKLMLIGIYARNIRFAAPFPLDFPISFLIAFDVQVPGKVKFEAETLLNGDRVFLAQAEADFEGIGLSLFRSPQSILRFKEGGELIFRARISHREWVDLWKGDVYN